MNYSLMGAKSCAARLALLCCIAACLGRISTAQTSSNEQTSIDIDARRILHSIPRSIYGTFLEPIGNSTYNWLWAEILQNPSFEDNLWEAKQIAEMVRDPSLETSRVNSELKDLFRASRLQCSRFILQSPSETLRPVKPYIATIRSQA
jgi:hypothetical protein